VANHYRNAGQSRWVASQAKRRAKLAKRRRLGKLAGPLSKAQLRALNPARPLEPGLGDGQ
jgi:hypothetical protein